VAGLIVALSPLASRGGSCDEIMLMSVTQRTREIGVRKAIGARRRDVILSILHEPGLKVRRVIGVLLGGAQPADHLAVPALPSSIPLWASCSPVGVLYGVGLVFGMYPAIKAARPRSRQALRYE